MLIPKQLVPLQSRETQHFYIWVCDSDPIPMVLIVSLWNLWNLNACPQVFGLRLSAHCSLCASFGPVYLLPSVVLSILFLLLASVSSLLRIHVKFQKAPVFVFY